MADKKGHIVESKWIEADAISLEERAVAIDEWLDHTDALVQMFKGDDKILTELRSLSGSLRTRRNDFSMEAAGLRTDVLSKDE